jgi:hypothetical protein
LPRRLDREQPGHRRRDVDRADLADREPLRHTAADCEKDAAHVRVIGGVTVAAPA